MRNYTECTCVQSRQVITPPTVGQRSQLRVVIVKTYLNENGYAVSGKCKRSCNTLIPFLVFLFIVTFITACAQPSAIIVTLRWGRRSECLGWVIRSELPEFLFQTGWVIRSELPEFLFQTGDWCGKVVMKAKWDCAGKCFRHLPGELKRREFSHVRKGKEDGNISLSIPEGSVVKNLPASAGDMD